MKPNYFLLKNNKNERIYCRNDRLNLGDIVKVKDFGFSYSTYTNAFIYFNILNSCVESKILNTKGQYRNPIKSKECYETNWVVIGFAIHPTLKDIIYCLKSPSNKYLVIGEEGVEKVMKYSNKSNIGFARDYNEIEYIP